ncbi:hypothetical protein AcW1_004422 [Taiwanofungus camphoratus]|nr:hypothetical protein AcW2_006571 [Antrodia cinnamomea]KAI0939348.1 hypothetical protein AcV5_000798 [Antrodia cinnamomea]KAI0959649.1 hypothetical protein AcW1_004422 [Antrodia cinnamomea]
MNTQQAPEWLLSYLVPFFTLSYPTAPPAEPDSFPNSSYYKNGLLDGCFIITCVAVMAVLRDLVRLWVLEPFARWKLTRDLRLSMRAKAVRANNNGKANDEANGNGDTAHVNGNGHVARPKNSRAVYIDGVPISKKEAKMMHRSVLRFAEQGWSFIYCTCIWSLGLYVHRNLPTKVLDPINVWLTYPHIPLPGPIKFYYLLQTGFWCHQILIINAEARRKDHWQMMTHHVITIVLLLASYIYNYTRIGCLIMLLMDWCDIILPLAKMFRYLAWSTLCDATFVLFLISWLVTRHVLFILAIWSTYNAQSIIPPSWDPERGHYKTRGMFTGFLTMLVMLQCIQIMWFWMICRVAWRVVSGQGAEDTRSDEEGFDSSEEEDKKSR